MIRDFFLSKYEIKRKTTQNTDGIATDTYTTVATVMGRMRTLGGSEIRLNEKNNYKSTHKFYCDVETVSVNDIICYDGKAYEIRHVQNPMEMSRFLQIDCELNETISATDLIIMDDRL